MEKSALLHQFQLTTAIRQFFGSKDFIDVLTPPIVSNPGMETHIHPFGLHHPNGVKKSDLYLHTSPEFHMKELLSYDFSNIFTLSYVFRDEPSSDIHRNQFIMLEWYRANTHYEKIMQDWQDLFSHCYNFFQSNQLQLNSKLKKFNGVWEILTIQDIFKIYLKFDILDFLETDALRQKIELDFKDVPLPQEQLPWDDLYFLLFLNKIEPQLINHPYLILSEYPAHLSALATIKPSDNRVAERFEVYLFGIELGNCFNELVDLEEQRSRWQQAKLAKKEIYNYQLPEPTILLNALDRGIPPAGGIAVGVERFLHGLSGIKNPFWPHSNN